MHLQSSLSRAKAWLPKLDPADIAIGYPSLKEDGTPFEQTDFAACVKEIRHVAIMIANEANLTKYHPAYNAANQRQPALTYNLTSLIQPIRKHTFAPEVDPVGLIDDEAEFEALNGIDWSSSTFQERKQGEEAERADPDALGQHEN